MYVCTPQPNHPCSFGPLFEGDACFLWVVRLGCTYILEHQRTRLCVSLYALRACIFRSDVCSGRTNVWGLERRPPVSGCVQSFGAHLSLPLGYFSPAGNSCDLGQIYEELDILSKYLNCHILAIEFPGQILSLSLFFASGCPASTDLTPLVFCLFFCCRPAVHDRTGLDAGNFWLAREGKRESQGEIEREGDVGTGTR